MGQPTTAHDINQNSRTRALLSICSQQHRIARDVHAHVPHEKSGGPTSLAPADQLEPQTPYCQHPQSPLHETTPQNMTRRPDYRTTAAVKSPPKSAERTQVVRTHQTQHHPRQKTRNYCSSRRSPAGFGIGTMLPAPTTICRACDRRRTSTYIIITHA